MQFCKIILFLLICATFSACALNIPKEALTLREDSLALRNLQTRKFETTDEKTLLVAAAGLLQDIGYQIEESEVSLGILVGSKQADATDSGQIATSILVGVFLGKQMPVDDHQKIRVSVVTRPANRSETALRITFQRTIWNNQGLVSRIESIEDSQIYQDFFAKLSKAVFLEAQQI